MGLSLNSGGKLSQETKNNLKDVTKYADPSANLDEESATANDKNNKNLKKTAIELVKIPIGAYDDTLILTVMGVAGAFDAKDKDKSKNTEEEDKIKTTLKNNILPSDPLSVGVSKIIKKKIENSSTPDASSKEIDDMLIKIMKDIEQQEDLISSMDSDSADDALEDIENTIDAISLINQILASDNKLADLKLIDLKTKLGRAESEKKYLEEIIKAYEDAEKEGSFQTEGISSIKTRLEDTNQTINNLKTEIQEYEDKLKEEETSTVETQETSTVETQETSADNKEPEETIVESKKAPTIKIYVIDLDTTSSPWIAIYTVQAVVTGEPFPTIGWSTGTWDQGKDTVKVYVKAYSGMNHDGITAIAGWATNSEGMAEDSITLVWEDVWTENGY